MNTVALISPLSDTERSEIETEIAHLPIESQQRLTR